MDCVGELAIQARVRPSLFGMKALFPEAETHAPVGKDFGVPDCQGRGVLSALAAGAQPVDAEVTRAAKAPPRSTGAPQFPNPWVCPEEAREGGAAQREVRKKSGLFPPGS